MVDKNQADGMDKKIKVGLVYGGKSCEHEVSIRSAKSISDHLDKNKYKVVEIFIDKKGNLASHADDIDVYFPIVHGTGGEDGRLQGYFETRNKAYVGADVLGSSLGFDKDVQKRLLRDAGIKSARFIVLRSPNEKLKTILKVFKFPLFVKPCNSGSSVGVTRVLGEYDLQKAILDAFKFDTKVIVEEFIDGREIEVSVLGNNNNQIASVVGEIVPQKKHTFYDYDAKYIDTKGARLIVLRNLDKKLESRIQKVALDAFTSLECYGMARVDMFLSAKNQIFVNEINTLPGFTSISMYPKLLEATGISYSNILDKLIDLAIEREFNKGKLKYDYFS